MYSWWEATTLLGSLVVLIRLVIIHVVLAVNPVRDKQLSSSHEAGRKSEEK